MAMLVYKRPGHIGKKNETKQCGLLGLDQISFGISLELKDSRSSDKVRVGDCFAIRRYHRIYLA